MDNEQYVKKIADTYKEAIEIVKKKSLDYSSQSDPFQNFRLSSLAGVEVDQAILIRILDKLSRISNLRGKEANVLDEKIDDTILDAINYLAILRAYYATKTTPRKDS